MAQFIIRVLVNGAAVLVASLIIPGIDLSRDPIMFLLVGVVFGVVNAVIRPLVLLLTCLLNVVTLGLFTLVVNAIMFGLTSVLADVLAAAIGRPDLHFRIDGFLPAFLGAIVAGIISFLLTKFLGADGDNR